jgi:uncharacterized protein (TIGR02001 family)
VLGARTFALCALAIAAPSFVPSAARAQVGLSATLYSDYRIRGFSLSGDKPAASLDFAFDHASGAYVGASIIADETRRSGLGFLGYVANIGYVTRLGGDTTWDVGAVDTSVNAGAYRSYTVSYGELYTGVTHNNFAAYLYFSPDYLREHVATLYADLSASFRPAQRWRLFAHAGVLTPVGGHEQPDSQHEQFDVRAGAAYDFGGGELQLAWTTASPYAEYPAGKVQSRGALIVQASYFF